MVKKSSVALGVLLLAGIAEPSLAQGSAAVAQSSNERVNLVIVYGDDPCPKDDGGSDIVVCGRKEEKDRYRIPEPLRGDPNAASNMAWGERYKSIEYVGRTGTESCTPIGGGGATGCFAQIAQKAKAERQQEANASWGELVAAERAKRLGRIDAESEEIEKRAVAEEKARVATPANND